MSDGMKPGPIRDNRFDTFIRSELINRIEALENALRQAREALEPHAEYQQVSRTGDSPRVTFQNEAHKALAAIDAVLSGAPPSELSDERILEIAANTPYDLRSPNGVEQRWAIAFARAVLAEGRKG